MRRMTGGVVLMACLTLMVGSEVAAFQGERPTPWGKGWVEDEGPPRPGGSFSPGVVRRAAEWNAEKFVRALYQGFLDRAGSPPEVAHWVGRLRSGYTRTEVVRDFMESDEYFVRQLYDGLLGRRPDPGGLSTHLDFLQRGGTRTELVRTILTSPEMANKLR